MLEEGSTGSDEVRRRGEGASECCDGGGGEGAGTMREGPASGVDGEEGINRGWRSTKGGGERRGAIAGWGVVEKSIRLGDGERGLGDIGESSTGGGGRGSRSKGPCASEGAGEAGGGGTATGEGEREGETRS